MEKPIKEFPDYFATDLGEIISYRRKSRKVLASSLCNSGYCGVLLRRSGKTFRRNVHRLVAIAFLDNTVGYAEVNHIDGDKSNNRVENLEWCSRSENMKHAYKTGNWGNQHTGVLA